MQTRHHHLLTLDDLDEETFDRIVRSGATLAANGIPATLLAGRVVGTLFTATSTRTRTAFAVAAARLGAGVLTYGPADLQLNTGESAEDTGRVLGSMLDALVVRTAGDPETVRALARHSAAPVVNAMTADEHPTQALADCATLLAHFGRLEGLRLLYLGEGNNTAAALALALARVPGAVFTAATPPGYAIEDEIWARAARHAERSGATLRAVSRPDADGPFDVVYTTRWQTTGTTKADPDWRRGFVPFRVDDHVLARYPGAVVMHDLPAHRGEEISADALDGPRSIAFTQARMKLFSAAAVLATLLVPECEVGGP